jgi:hypothetical protein
VRASGTPRVLTHDGEEITVIAPEKPKPYRRSRGRIMRRGDPLLRLIGSGHGDIPDGISERKHEFVARHKERA